MSGQTPSPVHSLPAGLFLGLTCEEVSGLSMAHAQALAMAVKQKNITLRVNQVSPLCALWVGWGRHTMAGNLVTGFYDATALFVPTQDLIPAGGSPQSPSCHLS